MRFGRYERFGTRREIENVLKSYGLAYNYFVIAVMHVNRTLFDLVLELQNVLVRTEIGHDLRDNHKMYDGH